MTALARQLHGSPGGRGAQTDSNRIWEVGKAPWQYQSITDAITAINAASPALSATNRGTLLIYPGKYTSTTTYTIPSWLTVKGFGRGSTQLQNDTTDLFTVGTGGNVWFQDFLVEGSPTVGLYAFNCNDQPAVHLNHVDMFDNGGTARQFFLKQEGSTWTILKIDNCDVDYNGLTGYACRIYNTSASARMVDFWVKGGFFDAFALTSGGGCFDLSKLRDSRFWHNVVRGTNASDTGVFRFTGIRVRNGGSTGITCELGGHYGVGVEGGSGGVACFGDANTTIDLYGNAARGAASSGTLNNRGNLTYIVQ